MRIVLRVSNVIRGKRHTYKERVGVVNVYLCASREATELHNESVPQRQILKFEDVFLKPQILSVVGQVGPILLRHLLLIRVLNFVQLRNNEVVGLFSDLAGIDVHCEG